MFTLNGSLAQTLIKEGKTSSIKDGNASIPACEINKVTRAESEGNA